MPIKDQFQAGANLLKAFQGEWEASAGADISGIESIVRNNSGAAFKDFRRDGVICHWNSECEKLYGYTAKQAIGSRVQELLLLGRSVSDFEQNIEKIFDGGKAIVPSVYNIRMQSGETKIVLSIMFAVFGGALPERVACIDMDITRRPWAENIICETEEHYRTLLETISMGIIEIDVFGRIVYANRNLHSIFGYSQEQLLGDEIFVLLPHEVERDYLKQYLSRLVKEQFLPLPYLGKGFKEDGKVIDIQVNWDYRRDKAGRVTGFIAIVSDISEQKRIERAHLESENRFKALVSNIPGAVYRANCDRQWTMKYISEAIEEVSGYPALDFVDNKVRSYASIIHPDDRGMAENVVFEAVDQKRPFDIEYRIIHACGTVRWVYEKGQGVFGVNGKLLYLDGIVFDVTSRKETESYLKLSEEILMKLTQKNLSLEVIRESLKIVKQRMGFEVVRIFVPDDGSLKYGGIKNACVTGDFDSSGIFVCPDFEGCKKTSCDSTTHFFYEDLLSDKAKAELPYFTTAGSFWGNSASDFNESVFAENVGYENSVYESNALILLRSDEQVVGILEVADSRAGLFTVKLINFLEQIGTKLSMALSKIKAQEKIVSLARFPFENPHMILRISLDGTILHCNPAGMTFLDEWDCVIGGICPEFWRDLVAEAINSGSKNFSTACLDGRTFSFVIVPLAELGYVNVYGHDVTEQTQAEAEMLRLNTELERRVVERTAKLAKTHKYLIQEIQERKAIERELLEISEREKRLIGQELHDSIGQKLAGVALMAKVLEQKLGDKWSEESSKASEIAMYVNEAMDHTRDLAKGLHPVDLVSGSLCDSLKELASMTERLFGIRCRCSFDRDILLNDNTSAIHLYRISQEAITNAVKHGKANNIQIELLGRKSKTVLRVENDGEDFPEVMPKKSGMGLQIMDYRAEMIGGALDVRCRQGGGTIVKCVFANGGC